MAFPIEGAWDTVGMCVRERDAVVVGEVYGDAEPEISCGVRPRVLSLDVDGRDLPCVGKRDPVAGGLLERFPGLRPVCFYSPYEPAAWAIISHRVRISDAWRPYRMWITFLLRQQAA